MTSFSELLFMLVHIHLKAVPGNYSFMRAHRLKHMALSRNPLFQHVRVTRRSVETGG